MKIVVEDVVSWNLRNMHTDPLKDKQNWVNIHKASLANHKHAYTSRILLNMSNHVRIHYWPTTIIMCILHNHLTTNACTHWNNVRAKTSFRMPLAGHTRVGTSKYRYQDIILYVSTHTHTYIYEFTYFNTTMHRDCFASKHYVAVLHPAINTFFRGRGFLLVHTICEIPRNCYASNNITITLFVVCKHTTRYSVRISWKGNVWCFRRTGYRFHTQGLNQYV